MFRPTNALVLLAVTMALLPCQVDAAPVMRDDARNVAENWVALIIHEQGSWGGSSSAKVADLQEVRRGNRTLGHYARVEPQGYLIISPRRELPPVKAYSDTSTLEIASNRGMADVIKRKLDRPLDVLEGQSGPNLSLQVNVSAAREAATEYLPQWEALAIPPTTFARQLAAGAVSISFQQSEILLDTSWNQQEPYNLQVPSPPPGSSCTAARCAAGCGPIAAAQVMKYWNWPPYRDPEESYDWVYIADRYVQVGSHWEDGLGNPLTTTHLDAVARLVHEVGIEAGADYCDRDCLTGTCFASCAYEDILDTFEDHFRYSTSAEDRYRDDYSKEEWFGLVKTEIDLNRPVPYRIVGHILVADGWKEEMVGEESIPWFHMNYGHDASDTMWYYVDTLSWGGVDEEILLENVYPAQALGSTLSGTYSTNTGFPYRYFDRDASGTSATFTAGQYLQFLPDITVTCTGDAGGSIRFDAVSGTNAYDTRIFSRGDPTRGLRMYSGTVRLSPGGSLRIT